MGAITAAPVTAAPTTLAPTVAVTQAPTTAAPTTAALPTWTSNTVTGTVSVITVIARGLLKADLLTDNMADFTLDAAAILAIEKTIADVLGVDAGIIDAGINAGADKDFQVEFTVTVPSDGSVSLTPESAQKTLSEADVAALLTNMQAKLDAETGVAGKYRVVPVSGGVVVTGPVEVTGITIVVPEASATTGDDQTQGEEAFAHGNMAFSAAQVFVGVALLVSIM